MKLYLDDERQTPEGWVRAYTAEEAILFLMENDVQEVSLDHDLGTEKTGYDVLLFIEEQFHLHGKNPPAINIHTANPSARIKMMLAKESLENAAKKL